MKLSRFSRKKYSRRGAAYFMALMLLAVMGVLALTMSNSSVVDLAKTTNHQESTTARMAAESGLNMALYWMGDIRLPGSTTPANYISNMSTALGEKINYSYSLDGQIVYIGETGALNIPAVSLPHGSFEAKYSYVAPDRIRVQAKGMYEGAVSYIAMDMSIVRVNPTVFDYGLASKGQIHIGGNAKVVGFNASTEGSVLSATESHDDAVHVDGNAFVSGDIYAAGENAHVVVSGSPTIGNTANPTEWPAHIHNGVAVPDFPGVDTSAIIPLATNVYTGTEGDVLTNIRIPAGTNPTFNNDMVINGVIYVEAPNKVKFAGKATLNGIIVTESTHPDISACELDFRGSVDAFGVEALPDTPEFAAVKEQTGTFILAPGFAVSFAGHVEAVNGSIAADQLTFLGTADGHIHGSVIGLQDIETVLGGNVEIKIDKSSQNSDPAGFVKSIAFEPLRSTYSEGGGY